MRDWVAPAAAVLTLVAAVAVTAWTAQGWRKDAIISQIRESNTAALAGMDRHAREVEAQYRRQEAAKEKAMEKEREEHRIALVQTASAVADAVGESERLRNVIATERRRAAQAARAAGRTVSAAEAPWVVLEECRRRYEEVAKDADELGDRLRIGAGYARAVKAQ